MLFGALLRSFVNLAKDIPSTSYRPMLRNVPQPFHARRLVGRKGPAGADVDLARNGLVDDGLLLLLQQRDQLLLGADVAPDAPVGVVEEADDGSLFGMWR